jgi:hypothetical protein
MEFVNWFSSALGQKGVAIFLLCVVGLFGSMIVLMYWKGWKEGRSVKLLGLEIGVRPSSDNKDTDPHQSKRDKAVPAEVTQLEKFMYVKLVHLRDRLKDSPVYRRRWPDGTPHDIYDEALYFVFHLYSEIQSFGKWNVRSSGVAHPEVIFPWLDQLLRMDPKDPLFGPVVSVNCNEPSNIYVPLTHMFNGQQQGEREVIMRTECFIRHARLTLDFSSVVGYRLTNLRAFKGGQHIAGYEGRMGIYTCETNDLEIGEHLRITYDLERSGDLPEELLGPCRRLD